MKQKNFKIFLFFILIAFYIAPMSQLYANICKCSFLPKKVKAVSINALQKKIKGSKTKSQSSTFLHFVGLKKIIGFIVDEKNNDLVLLGEDNRNQPPLYLEDFVVALRNTFLQYAPLKGNVYQYTYPGCSIDPRPSNIKQLTAVGRNILQSSKNSNKQLIQKWKETCQQSQDVRVLGMPFDTHFAHVLVIADYDMKSIVDGTDRLENIDNFQSLLDMSLDKASDDALNDRPMSVSFSMNRFWFYPGDNLYEEDDGIIMIKQCPVTLLTNETYLNQNDKVVDAKGPNEDAQLFAHRFSLLYNEISDQRPIYSELSNLFRFVAIAKIIEFKKLENSLNLKYLLEDFNILKTKVDKQLPGRSAVKNFDHRKELPNGYQSIHIILPSCGGVDVSIKTTNSQFIRRHNNDLKYLKKTVLSKKGQGDISWSVDLESSPYLSEYHDTKILNRVNTTSQTASVIMVKRGNINEEGKEGYICIDGKNEIYRGQDIIELNKKLTSELKNKKNNKKFYISIKGFPKHKARSFRKNLIKSNKNINVKTLEDRDDNLNLIALFTPGYIYHGHNQPLEYKGRFRGILRFSKHIQKKIFNISINVFAQSAAIVSDFMVHTDLLLKLKIPMSIIDSVNHVKRMILKRHKNLTEDKLNIEVDVQCTGVHTVHIEFLSSMEEG